MKIAIEGCAHGELDKIYACIEAFETRENIKIDLLICCGDFQSVRNSEDLRAMAVPEKYQHMCSFYKYYSGELKAPILTIFIGGNHEASNYLQELPYGGWVAPNIYYLGRAGVVKFGNLRIGGISGIFKGQDYQQGLWECPPYTQKSLRSVYHIRSLDVFRLSQLKDEVHVMLSHDWPRGITDYGEKENLLRRKPFLREDIESNQLGSVPAEKLLNLLKPEYWFSAHLHCKFIAEVEHDEEKVTKFLALDKCLPRRRHLQVLDLPPEYDGDKLLKFDEEWLAVLKNTNHLLSVRNINCYMPGPGGDERYDFTPTAEEKARIVELLQNLTITEDMFVRTAPIYNNRAPRRVPTNPIANPQTVKLCEMIGIDDPVQVIMARTSRLMTQPQDIKSYDDITKSPENESMQSPARTPITKLSLPAPVTPNEITYENESLNTTVDTTVSPSTSFASETTNNSTIDCATPVSSSSKTQLQTNSKSVHYINKSAENESMQSSLKTPMTKLSLPAPVTPSEKIHENESLNTTVETTISPSTSISSETTNTSVVDCATPGSNSGKKTFKRRNMSIYNTPDADDESVTTTSSSLADSDSPRSSKIPYKGPLL